MTEQPLTPEQIWGLPAEQLPQNEPKDFFDFIEQEESPDRAAEENLERKEA